MAEALTVSQLTRRIKNTLEGDPGFQRLQVEGEISNLTIHRSGHVYFSLKDTDAQILCVMFSSAIRGSFAFAEGDKVVASGAITVYSPRGSYQLQVRSLRPLGQGDLYRQFVELKERLQLEGLFDTAHKRPLPYLPRHIVVITSPTGAVIRDILNTLNRRFPHIRVTLLPAQVQGEAAIPSLLAAFDTLDNLPEVDVAILARGGGSMEDLWCFNSEALAYAIYQSPVPVISAIGHETDFTIADFVADVRAPTPTAAAELSVPEGRELEQRLDDLAYTAEQYLMRRLGRERERLHELEQRIAWALRAPLREARAELAGYAQELRYLMQERLEAERLHLYYQQPAAYMQARLLGARHGLATLEAQLQAHDVKGLLKRGFTITIKEGRRIKSKTQLNPGDILQTVLADGTVTSKVED